MIFTITAHGPRVLLSGPPSEPSVVPYAAGNLNLGAANLLYESAPAPAAWGRRHDRPLGMVAFGDEPLMRRILDPDGRLAFWAEHPRAATSPPSSGRRSSPPTCSRSSPPARRVSSPVLYGCGWDAV